MQPQRIFLIGLMGSGKSTVGKILANRLDMVFFDSDDEVEKRNGVDIQTIFEIEGEQGFREREQVIISELAKKPNAVIATGGGVVLSVANRFVMNNSGVIIYLKASVNSLYARIKNSSHRPLLKTKQPKAKLAELYFKRRAIYENLADISIHTNNTMTRNDVVYLILKKLETYEKTTG